jgi:lysophospholipase L1-like esterase
MTALKKIFKYSFLILMGAVLGISLLEIAVRVVLGAKPETYLREFSRYHPTLGWEKTPNKEGYFRRGDALIHEKMNSKGLRDREYPYEKADRVFRILVLGDSFTEGYDVNIDDLFTEILETGLNREDRSKRYEVINAGTGGYSTDQEYLFYLIEGHKYKPDIVVLMTYLTNDVYYNIQPKYGNYFKPLFERSGDSLKLIETPLPQPAVSESAKNIFRHLALYPIVSKIILSHFPTLARWMHNLGWISKSTMDVAVANPNGKTYPTSFEIYAKEYDASTDHAWSVTELIIGNLKRSVESAGARLVVCAIPDKFEIDSLAWTRTQNMYRVNNSIWDIHKPRKKLAAICEARNISYLDLAQCFTTISDRVPLYNGVHWNGKGNRMAADCLKKHLFQGDE